MTGHSVAAVCRTLKVSRSTAYRPTRERPRVYRRCEDRQVLDETRAITLRRDSYGYRRVTARVNRLFGRRYNEMAPHSALGMKSPREYRAERTLTASL